MENLPALNPYLTVKGAKEAIAFYEKAFGASEAQVMPTEDGKRVMHAEITINGGKLMLSDEFPEMAECGGPVLAPTAERPSPVAIALHFKAPTEIDSTYNRAIEAGCTSVLAPEDTFWNARFAMLLDPYGHRWMLNAPLPAQS